jgi:integrase/recombinase XerC
MLEGWSAQQRSRLLTSSTIETRVQIVRRFASFTNDYPWQWSPADAEDWTSHLVSAGRAHSTVRGYEVTIALFLGYVCDPRYGWGEACETRFQTHPVQVFHEWNSAVHRADYEGRPGRRPLTRTELQRFFDFCDDQVEAKRRLGRKGYLAAFRDAALMKATYAWGLRRREAVMLDAADLRPSVAAPEFGEIGVISVRYGKASRGGPPKRRSVLTVMAWSSEVMAEYLAEVRPAYGTPGQPGLWLTERGGRVSVDHLTNRFANYRDELGLPRELSPHCLRHSYVTHLIEDGFDPFFVQQQVGHAWGATTALYTGVSGDYKNRALRRVLDRAVPGPSPSTSTTDRPSPERT